MEKPFRSEQLKCGCCWEYFKTWEGYVDQDQDCWYGICKPCQAEDEKRNKAQYDEMFALIYGSLSPANKTKMDADIAKHGEERKTVIVNWALDKKIIWFEICRH